MKSGSLNLLEPSGPVKACNGIALPYGFSYSPIDINLPVSHTPFIFLVFLYDNWS
jgi:hypothetical protein